MYKSKETYLEIREWIERIVIFVTILVVIVLVYATNYYKTLKEELKKENRIDNIEKTLQEHMHYIDKLEADIDNLKEVQDR